MMFVKCATFCTVTFYARVLKERRNSSTFIKKYRYKNCNKIQYGFKSTIYQVQKKNKKKYHNTWKI